jgi:hypothetical protein
MSHKLTSTKNYRLFELCPFNRDVTKVAKLHESMKRHGFIPAYPLHCVRNGDGKLRIKAGHHRFEVASSLGIAVYYIVCEDEATIHELEAATNPWKLADYVKSYMHTDAADYLAIHDFSTRTGIGIGHSACLLAGESTVSSNQHHKIKDGGYVVKDREFAEKVGSIVTRCRDIGVTFATKANFVAAVSSMCRLDEFDPDTFIHRIAVNLGLAKPQASLNDYLSLIETIYNMKAQNRVALAFLSKKAARERSAAAKAHAKKLAGEKTPPTE